MNNPIKTESILSLTNDRGVIPYSEKGDIGNKSKEDLSKYKLASRDFKNEKTDASKRSHPFFHSTILLFI